MLKNARNFIKSHLNPRLTAGVMLVVTAGNAMAAAGDGSVDTSSILTAVAGGLAAALIVSVAWTAATVSVKASKLPRRGA